jgi:hypothetical protein
VTPDETPDDAQIEGFGDEVEQALAWQHRRKRRGHTVLTVELLARLFNLPEGSEITGIHPDPRVNGLLVTFVSDDLPEIEDAMVSPYILGMGELKLVPASAIDDLGHDREPQPDDVLFANIQLSLDFPQEASS